MDSMSREYAGYDPSPIDIVEDLAEARCWDVDRLGDDQIAMAAEGAWRTYSLSLAWYDPTETLRMVCTFDMAPPEHRLNELYKTIEAANDRLWIGGFNLWRDQSLMAYRYGLTLHGGAGATFEQVDAMLRGAVENCECYFPAFHLVSHESATTEAALAAALSCETRWKAGK
ncbi:MAG: YbjN domain-containing protein [Pseudomonadota bacterium]